MSSGFECYRCSKHAMISYLDEEHSAIDEENSDSSGSETLLLRQLKPFGLRDCRCYVESI